MSTGYGNSRPNAQQYTALYPDTNVVSNRNYAGSTSQNAGISSEGRGYVARADAQPALDSTDQQKAVSARASIQAPIHWHRNLDMETYRQLATSGWGMMFNPTESTISWITQTMWEELQSFIADMCPIVPTQSREVQRVTMVQEPNIFNIRADFSVPTSAGFSMTTHSISLVRQSAGFRWGLDYLLTKMGQIQFGAQVAELLRAYANSHKTAIATAIRVNGSNFIMPVDSRGAPTTKKILLSQAQSFALPIKTERGLVNLIERIVDAMNSKPKQTSDPTTNVMTRDKPNNMSARSYALVGPSRLMSRIGKYAAPSWNKSESSSKGPAVPDYDAARSDLRAASGVTQVYGIPPGMNSRGEAVHFFTDRASFSDFFVLSPKLFTEYGSIMFNSTPGDAKCEIVVQEYENQGAPTTIRVSNALYQAIDTLGASAETAEAALRLLRGRGVGAWHKAWFPCLLEIEAHDPANLGADAKRVAIIPPTAPANQGQPTAGYIAATNAAYELVASAEIDFDDGKKGEMPVQYITGGSAPPTLLNALVRVEVDKAKGTYTVTDSVNRALMVKSIAYLYLALVDFYQLADQMNMAPDWEFQLKRQIRVRSQINVDEVDTTYGELQLHNLGIILKPTFTSKMSLPPPESLKKIAVILATTKGFTAVQEAVLALDKTLHSNNASAADSVRSLARFVRIFSESGLIPTLPVILVRHTITWETISPSVMARGGACMQFYEQAPIITSDVDGSTRMASINMSYWGAPVTNDPNAVATLHNAFPTRFIRGDKVNNVATRRDVEIFRGNLEYPDDNSTAPDTIALLVHPSDPAFRDRDVFDLRGYFSSDTEMTYELHYALATVYREVWGWDLSTIESVDGVNQNSRHGNNYVTFAGTQLILGRDQMQRYLEGRGHLTNIPARGVTTILCGNIPTDMQDGLAAIQNRSGTILEALYL